MSETPPQRSARLQRNAFIRAYLLEHPCACGEADPDVLDFDHVGSDKTESVSRLVQRRYSLTRIMDEMKKCVVRCANCHRRVTAQRRRGG